MYNEDLIITAFENLNWEVGGYCDGVIYEFVQVVPQYDTWSYDDIFRGEHKGVKFEISESKFYKELFPEYTDKKGNQQNGIMRKVFQGVVIKLEMNKNFSGHTLIKPNTLLHNPPMEYLSRTILESSVFENKYDVFIAYVTYLGEGLIKVGSSYEADDRGVLDECYEFVAHRGENVFRRLRKASRGH